MKSRAFDVLGNIAIVNFSKDVKKNEKKKFAEKILKQFEEAGEGKEGIIRVEIDFKDETVQNRIREAELQKIPYIIVIGDKEQKAGTLAVRHENKVKFGVKPEDLIRQMLDEIERKK